MEKDKIKNLLTIWENEKTKESAYNLKLPLSAVYHEQEIHDIPHEHLDMDKATLNIHDKMESLLKPMEFRVYSLLFIHHKTELEVIEILNWSKDQNKDLVKVKQLRKKIVEKVKKRLYAGEIDI